MAAKPSCDERYFKILAMNESLPPVKPHKSMGAGTPMPAPVAEVEAVIDTGAATQEIERIAADLVERYWAFVPCAGVGTRAMGADRDLRLPKQYQSVAGWPLVLHTLAAFLAVRQLSGIVVGVSDGDQFLQRYPHEGYTLAHCGGPTRADTVTGGLHALLAQGAQPHDWVLVHDAARCLVTPAQIERLIQACAHDPVGGLMALRLPDTLKAAVHDADGRDRVVATVERADKWLAQTPQMFRIATLLQALQSSAEVTDEASAVEAMGLRPQLVMGSAHNLKVTYPDDFALAEAVLAQRMAKPNAVHTVAHFFDMPAQA